MDDIPPAAKLSSSEPTTMDFAMDSLSGSASNETASKSFDGVPSEPRAPPTGPRLPPSGPRAVGPRISLAQYIAAKRRPFKAATKSTEKIMLARNQIEQERKERKRERRAMKKEQRAFDEAMNQMANLSFETSEKSVIAAEKAAKRAAKRAAREASTKDELATDLSELTAEANNQPDLGFLSSQLQQIQTGTSPKVNENQASAAILQHPSTHTKPHHEPGMPRNSHDPGSYKNHSEIRSTRKLSEYQRPSHDCYEPPRQDHYQARSNDYQQPASHDRYQPPNQDHYAPHYAPPSYHGAAPTVQQATIPPQDGKVIPKAQRLIETYQGYIKTKPEKTNYWRMRILVHQEQLDIQQRLQEGRLGAREVSGLLAKVLIKEQIILNDKRDGFDYGTIMNVAEHYEAVGRRIKDDMCGVRAQMQRINNKSKNRIEVRKNVTAQREVDNLAGSLSQFGL